MSIPVNNLIRSARRKSKEPLKILWMPYDGIFDNIVFNAVNHVFYGAHDVEMIPWDIETFYPAKNFYTLSAHNQLSLDYTFDAIICNDIIQQFDRAKVLSDVLHIPLAVIQHQVPPPIMKVEDIHIMIGEKNANMHIVTHDLLNSSWLSYNTVLEYGVPTLYDPKIDKNNMIILIGTFNEKDRPELLNLQHMIPNLEIVGDNPGLSKPLPFDQLVNKLQKSKFILNVSNTRSLPLTLLLGMSAGCIPISNSNPFIKDILDKVGIFYTNKKELIQILQNTQYPQQDNIKDILDITTSKFSIQKFTENLNAIFTDISNDFYVRT